MEIILQDAHGDHFKMTEETPLHEIAQFVWFDWKNVNFAAKPYLEAMQTLNKITENYLADSGQSVVLYALCNMTSYRGENAKAIKKLLKKMAGLK